MTALIWYSTNTDTQILYLQVSEVSKMNGEESDQLTPLSSDNSVVEQILAAKTGDPSNFPSFWEMDENDVEVSFISYWQYMNVSL